MKFLMIIVLTLIISITEGFSATSLKKTYQWPYTSAAPYLQPAPNALVAGQHHDYPLNGVVIWATGDSVLILNGDDLSQIRSFRVSTKTIIYDFFYKDDAGSETLFVAAGDGGLQIYDLSDLSSSADFTPLGSYFESPDNPGYLKVSETKIEEKSDIDAKGLGYYNNHVFLADMHFGLRVIDVSDPATISEVPLSEPDPSRSRISGYIQPNIYGSLDTTGGYTNAEALRYKDKTYVFVLDYYYGLRVFDVTEPSLIAPPVSKNMKTNVLYGTLALVTDVFAAIGSDSRLYAYVTALDIFARDSVVARLDLLSNEGILEEDSIRNIGRCITPGESGGVFVKDELAFVADGDRGLQIVDLSAGLPNDAGVLAYSIVGSFETELKGANSLYNSGNKLFMSSALKGLQEIDITTLSMPSPVRTLNSPISGDSLDVKDDYLYLLDGDSGLRIFELSDSSSFYLKACLENPGPLYDIHVSNKHAYIANGGDGLLIVDVSTPSLPVIAASKDTAGIALAVDSYKTSDFEYICVADGVEGLSIINASDPDNPGNPVNVTTAGFSSGNANDVSVLGNYAYVADGGYGLKIVELKAALPFSVVAAKDTAGNAVSVSAFENNASVYAVISDDLSGIMIENVTDPQAIPETVSVIAPPSGSHFISLEMADHYLFAAAEAEGFFVYDLSQPSNPVLLCSQESKGLVKALAPYKKDDTFYLASAEDNNGVAHYRLSFDITTDPPQKPSDSADTGCFITNLK